MLLLRYLNFSYVYINTKKYLSVVCAHNEQYHRSDPVYMYHEYITKAFATEKASFLQQVFTPLVPEKL